MVRAQPPSEEHQKAEDLEDLVGSFDLPSVESLKDRGALTPTVASLAALLPAEHLATWEAITPINAADQGVTATTAYYPMANKRAELAIKAAKTFGKMFVTGNLGPQGTLYTDRFAQALLEHRTTAHPPHELSPAMIIIVNKIKSFLPIEVDKYQPQRETPLREQAQAKQFSNMEIRLLMSRARLQGSSCHGPQPTTKAPPAGGPTSRLLLPWTPAPFLLPRTPTYHQGSSCRGPDFEAPPAVDSPLRLRHYHPTQEVLVLQEPEYSERDREQPE